MNKKLQTLTIFSLAMLIFVLGGIAARQAPVAEIMDYLEDSFVYLPFVANQQATQEVVTNTLYVFSSTETVVGGDGGGRSGMGSICTAEDPGSHFCTLEQIENAMVTTGVNFKSTFSTSWVDRISPGVWDNTNCFAWLDTGYSGTQIMSGASHLALNSCDVAYPVACCKWVP